MNAMLYTTRVAIGGDDEESPMSHSQGMPRKTPSNAQLMSQNSWNEAPVEGLGLGSTQKLSSVEQQMKQNTADFASRIEGLKDKKQIAELYKTLVLDNLSSELKEEEKAKATQRLIEEAPFRRDSLTGLPKHHWANPIGFFERCRESRLWDILVKPVWMSKTTVEELDGIIGVLSTLNALIIAVPFSLLTAIGLPEGAWLTLAETISGCSTSDLPNMGIVPTDLTDKKAVSSAITSYVTMNHFDISRLLLAGILIPIGGIVCSVWFYITRPTIEAKYGTDGKAVSIGADPRFRIWWVRGRYLVFTVLVLTATAMLLVIFCTTRFYLLFSGNSSTYCQDYRSRDMDLKVAWGLVIGLLGSLLYVFI
jgi:hypothetical protein